MKKRVFSLIALFPMLLLSAQSLDWTREQKVPQVFIENHGQYNQYFTTPDNIRYGIDYGFGWRVIFSDKQTAIVMQKLVVEESENESELQEFRSREVFRTIIVQEWLNTNPDIGFTPVDIQPDYYTYSYPSGDDYVNVDHANACKKLRRNNLYNGIDLEYTIPEQGGFKYTLTVAPGANPAEIKFKYSGSPVSIDSDGNLRMPAVIGELYDYAPKAWYADNELELIDCEFSLDGDQIGFELGNYDHARAIVIDPWTINPALPAPFNKSYDVDNDAAGNVWVWGGGMGFNLKKYNAAGTLQWTHISPWDTSNAWFGELLTLSTGDSYISSGSAAKLRRLTTAGATSFTNNGPFFNLDEYWNMTLNCNSSKLVIGGTRIISLTSPQGHVFDVNMTNGNQLAGSPYNIRPSGMKEVRGLALGGDGNFYAFTNDNLVALNQTFGIIYSVAHTTGFGYYSPSYMANGTQGVNNIDANLTHVYINYGNVVEKRLNSTGAFVASAAITGGAGSTGGGLFGTGPGNSGCVVDDCGNVYVGSSNAVYKYDANLNLLGSVATSGPVYDLKIAAAGTLIIGGDAFLTSNTSLAPCAPHSVTCTPPLPVEMLSFTGVAADKKNLIEWTTVSEINNDYFVLEKSNDAENYVDHATIDGAGNSNIELIYSNVDTRPFNTTYYRLKQVDINGEEKYYGPIVITNNNLNGLRVQSIYPNPAHTEFTINLFAEVPSLTTIEVLNQFGKILYCKSLMVEGETLFNVSTETWAAGIYFIRCTDQQTGSQTTHRIIVQ